MQVGFLFCLLELPLLANSAVPKDMQPPNECSEEGKRKGLFCDAIICKGLG
jgi:hypothetical protein